MEESQIRRVPVVDGGGMCCGIVSQADIAMHASRKITADLVKDVSQPARALLRANAGHWLPPSRPVTHS